MAFLSASIFVAFVLTLLYLVSFWVSLKRGSIEKLSPYESGFEPTKDARIQFDIIFWRVALLYLIFDLELLFLFPYGSVIS
jgi:NADH-quinone oxidoreductase subunit A